jgi:hypothetical protein
VALRSRQYLQVGHSAARRPARLGGRIGVLALDKEFDVPIDWRWRGRATSSPTRQPRRPHPRSYRSDATTNGTARDTFWPHFPLRWQASSIKRAISLCVGRPMGRASLSRARRGNCLPDMVRFDQQKQRSTFSRRHVPD